MPWTELQFRDAYRRAVERDDRSVPWGDVELIDVASTRVDPPRTRSRWALPAAAVIVATLGVGAVAAGGLLGSSHDQRVAGVAPTAPRSSVANSAPSEPASTSTNAMAPILNQDTSNAAGPWADDLYPALSIVVQENGAVCSYIGIDADGDIEIGATDVHAAQQLVAAALVESAEFTALADRVHVVSTTRSTHDLYDILRELQEDPTYQELSAGMSYIDDKADRLVVSLLDAPDDFRRMLAERYGASVAIVLASSRAKGLE